MLFAEKVVRGRLQSAVQQFGFDLKLDLFARGFSALAGLNGRTCVFGFPLASEVAFTSTRRPSSFVLKVGL